MNLFSFIENYADQIGGQFTNYDSTKAVIVVPLNDGRFQTVLATVSTNESTGRTRIIFSSKASDFNPGVDLKGLIEKSSGFDYSRVVIQDNQLKIEATCGTESASEGDVKHMIQEVASEADKLELLLTGKDIH